MLRMLCRNTLADDARWKSMFDAHAHDHRQAGLSLESLWRSRDDPDEVFFVFTVADIGRAKALAGAPEAAQAGKASSVLDGD